MKRTARHNFKGILLRRDGRCLVCGAYLDEDTINPHHITTKGAGGSDQPENGISLCQACHVSVHNGHITPATLRWILWFAYNYEYQDWELGNENDRQQAFDLLHHRVVYAPRW
jgi:5-methylcytosine-specific restriction endonuclease McrA